MHQISLRPLHYVPFQVITHSPPSCHSVLYILSYKYFVQINHKFYDRNQLYKFLRSTINTKIHEIRIYKEHYGIHEPLESLPLESQASNGQVVKTSKVHKISFFSTQFNVVGLLTIPIIRIPFCTALLF